ncbi:cytochrome b/b6 domain-containing protein [Cupriavidus oxalaticus]|uniref:cytochrome b/b6 domain-containing protein n=1 Tax=Cupriavidus oxalaticus TaxID=96344 RepID=UPI00317C43F3
MQPARRSILVWDPIVRITHWSVAALVLWDLYEDSGGPLHRNLGYAAACLVLVRMVWGVAGPGAGNFRAWVPTPRGILAYARAAAAGRPPRYLSHSPPGAMMMLTLWIFILALAFTGWLSRLDRFWGEDGPKDFHAILAYVLMALVGVHIVAAVFMSWLHKENLVLAMVTGRKPAEEEDGPLTDAGSANASELPAIPASSAAKAGAEAPPLRPH